MNYYSHNIGDYAQATMHLSLIEDAVYSRLLRRYYAEEMPLVDDLAQLCRWVGARTEEEREAVEVVLKEFFELRDGYWHNNRADREIEAYHAKSTKAAQSAAKRWQPKQKPESKQQQSEGNTVAMRTHSERNANQEPITKNQEKTKDSSSEAVASDVDGGAYGLPPPENPKPEKFTPDDYRLAERMAQAVLLVAPKSKPPDISKWADTIRLMRERDGLTLGEITEVFRFAHNDSFWKTNILSPTKLREQFARLDAQMRIPTNEKRHTTSADRWAIDHDDTSWLTGTPGSGDCIDGELDFPPNADDLHCLEAGRGGRH